MRNLAGKRAPTPRPFFFLSAYVAQSSFSLNRTGFFFFFLLSFLFWQTCPLSFISTTESQLSLGLIDRILRILIFWVDMYYYYHLFNPVCLMFFFWELSALSSLTLLDQSFTIYVLCRRMSDTRKMIDWTQGRKSRALTEKKKWSASVGFKSFLLGSVGVYICTCTYMHTIESYIHHDSKSHPNRQQFQIRPVCEWKGFI